MLERILAGDAEKQAARELGLRPTTVHEYIGELYRRFHVESRGELMAYFVSRRPRPFHDAPTPAGHQRPAAPNLRRSGQEILRLTSRSASRSRERCEDAARIRG
jgi:hypothetical protein